jgi:hypothetical protein
MNAEKFDNKDLEQIFARLDYLEERIAKLETNKELSGQEQNHHRNGTDAEDSGFVNVNLSLSAPFEANLGEYGLAWLGNIVLFFAIAFLWQYFNNAGKPLISLIVGLISAVAVFSLSQYFRKTYTYLSFTFNLFGFVILYYILLRLHYYSNNPLVPNQTVATVFILMLIGIQFGYAMKKHSQIMAALAFTLALITAFICYHRLVFMLISIATTGLALYLFWKYNWWKAMTLSLCLGFLVSLIWLLKNPVSLVKTPEDLTYHYAFICFSLVAAMFSLAAFRKPDKDYPENLILSILLLTGTAYSVLLLVLVLMHFPTSFVPFFIAVSIYCIAYSVILKFYSPWGYAPALYALYGFIAISVAVFGTYHFPDSFLLLILQSFLVLILAIWYRSHIITLMNTFLLVLLAIFYYKTSGSLHSVNFSIPVVAFLSARIINWQKERLNIKTDFIRNMYLFILFFSLLYATYKGLPGKYITVSWLVVAGIYFALSIILDNFKYRWMAMANLLVSAFHLFLVDLAKIDIIFRILAFLVFAVVSILISIYYVKKLKEKETDSESETVFDQRE